MATEEKSTSQSYERLLDKGTDADDIQAVYRRLKEAGYGETRRSAGPVVREERRSGEKDRRDTPARADANAPDPARVPQGRRSADHFPPVEPKHRRQVNRWAATARLLLVGPRERFYDFVSIFRRSTRDLVNPRLLEAIAPRTAFLNGNPYTFSLATNLGAIRSLSRTLLGLPANGSANAPRRPTSEGADPGERLFATLRKRDPFAVELLMRLARDNSDLTGNLQYLELTRKKRGDIQVHQLARVTRETWALFLVTEQLSADALAGIFHEVQEAAVAVGYSGQRGITVGDACDILGICIENLSRFASELYPVALKAIGAFFPPEDASERKVRALRNFAGVAEEEILTREVFQEAVRRRKEAEDARQQEIELETAMRGEEAGISSAFGTTLRILGSMFPDSGLARIDQNPYLLPFFDNRVFIRDLPFAHGSYNVDQIARHDPLQLVLVLHRIIDNILSGVNAASIQSLLDRHGFAESFAQIVTDWTTAYDAVFVPYVRAVNEYAKEVEALGSADETNPVIARLTEEIAQLRDRSIKGYGGSSTARDPEGLRLWSLAERLTLLLELVGEEINPDVAKRDDPVSKRIYRAIASDPVFDFGAGGGDAASVMKPVIRQLRRYVEAKYKSGIASVPRVSQLFAIDFLRAIAELYRFLLNDERSMLRSAGRDVLLSGSEEEETWERERASQSGSLEDRLRIRLDEHAETSFTDALTGMRNKEFYINKLPARFDALAKAGRPISVIMIDIDHFKWVNDSLGHQTGDLVLKDAAQTILDGARRGQDVAIRYGGEEMLLLTPSPLHAAAALAERIRNAQQSHVTERELYEPIAKIGTEREESCGTFSMGVVERRPDEALEQAVDRADKALYAAKETRNRVSIGNVPAKGTTQVNEPFADYVSRVRSAAREK